MNQDIRTRKKFKWTIGMYMEKRILPLERVEQLCWNFAR